MVIQCRGLTLAGPETKRNKGFEMLSASCYFRGNYLTPPAASKLLMGVCAIPELVPDYWYVFEPIDIPFNGKTRLIGVGWERVEEIGDGLACYATENIDDANSRERRSIIAKAIEELVWTTGCKPDQKRIPDFDFSEQLAALAADAAKKAFQSPGH